MSATVLQEPHRRFGPPDQIPWDALRMSGTWILAAAGIGFTVSGVGTRLLELSRSWSARVRSIAVALLTTGYVRTNELVSVRSSVTGGYGSCSEAASLALSWCFWSRLLTPPRRQGRQNSLWMSCGSVSSAVQRGLCSSTWCP
jgi:hypothetical protein